MPDHYYILVDKRPRRDNKPSALFKKIKKELPRYYLLYKVAYDSKLNNQSLFELSDLLNASKIYDDSKPLKANILIASRSGILSPWSEKASQIFTNYGFNKSFTIEKIKIYYSDNKNQLKIAVQNIDLFYDKMIEKVFLSSADIKKYLSPIEDILIDRQMKVIKRNKLMNYNNKMGLALSSLEIEYLNNIYKKLKRNLTDIELMMFAQINSEHCRHKIFNSEIISNNKKNSLFNLIKSTFRKTNIDVISAYKDNCSVIKSNKASFQYIDFKSSKYKSRIEDNYFIIKAETHNHPTAIAPYAGAATGSGGEIRDEGSTGRGSIPKTGFTGYTLSNLRIPNSINIWENAPIGSPERIKSPLEIILQAPIGAASYNNEFGRPNIYGFFRTYESNPLKDNHGYKSIGYHKPIMLAGGVGQIRHNHLFKKKLVANDLIVVLGGPSYLIGIGGGAASSLSSGSSSEKLDFSSVQRDNPEIERRCQEVINHCVYLDNKSPIKSIHDIGAGGLCNAVPEIVNESNKGAIIYMSKIPIGEKSMSPLEIWCNESQERYVIILSRKNLNLFDALSNKENCPYSVIGNVTDKKSLIVYDKDDESKVINLPMSYLLGKPPIKPIHLSSYKSNHSTGCYKYLSFKDAIKNILLVPAVADKGFLITIGDRSVTGLVARDQLIGEQQVPVSDAAITMSGIGSKSGQAMAMGERPSIAITDPAASVEIAFGETITNISCVYLKDISKIKLSANWMASSKNHNELEALYNGVRKISDLCKNFNITIPVGKDSLSMNTNWKERNACKEVESPLSLILTAFSSVEDVSKCVTPNLHGNGELFLIDISNGQSRLGGSSFHQIHNIIDVDVPRIDDIQNISLFFNFIQNLIKDKIISAYHDKSDGGLFVTLMEMALSGNISVNIHKSLERYYNEDLISKFFFNEELGSVVEVNKDNIDNFYQCAIKHKIEHLVIPLGSSSKKSEPTLMIKSYNDFNFALSYLRKYWSKLSYDIQKLRDNPITSKQEYDSKIRSHTKIIRHRNKLTFNLDNIKINKIKVKRKPKVAILREQGINGHREMAYAFKQSGFESYDVHINSIKNNEINLNQFEGIVACGGFSYGDVLGAGRGWSSKILHNPYLKDNLEKFFSDKNKFALGICNGCQMFSQLKSIIPGSDHWPIFIKNQSRQFEARLSRVKINKSKSLFLNGMTGSFLPIVVSHGEGKTYFQNKKNINSAIMSYVDDKNKTTENYPANPNGSKLGGNGFCNTDGRVTILMPHPERLYSISQYSYISDKWEVSPWSKFFINARNWLN